MSDVVTQINNLESESILASAPCADGAMPFRVWQPFGGQEGGELLVLLHGGSGSWNHWIKNIPTLSNYFELLVPDLPGLGDSSRVPKQASPEDVAGIVAKGLKTLVGPRRFHLICFSWGSVVGSLAAAQLGDQVKSILLVGPASLGRMSSEPVRLKLRSRSRDMSMAEIDKVNRENLAQLMIFDRNKIDPLAVHLQHINTTRARYNSPQYANDEFVLDGLKNTSAPLLVIYGSEDVVAANSLVEREQKIKAVKPDAQFEVIPGIGHWLQYEHQDWFNSRAIAWIEQNIFL
ncbi:MAG: 2-hydroxy-6-oxonona-2,4-dienedioate hydrolase [Patiriisocius sp.]|jgi:2-hydroxy-6-oxonona-2,4-dienedioate hydrolase